MTLWSDLPSLNLSFLLCKMKWQGWMDFYHLCEHSWTPESLLTHGIVLGASQAGKGTLVDDTLQEAGVSGGGWLIPGPLLHFGRVPYRARGGASWHWLHSVSPRTWWHLQLLLRPPASGSLSALPVSWFWESSHWGNGPCSLQVASSGALWGRGQMGKNRCLLVIFVTPSLICTLHRHFIKGLICKWPMSIRKGVPHHLSSRKCKLKAWDTI